MGILDETRFIERMQFFNGQRLFASDLQGLEAFNREMRWLHNRSLHQPGIGSGFAVYGKKGDREIRIKAGYAVDALGREIVLTETRVEPVPPVAGEDDGESVFYNLTVSYPDDTELEEAETREGICLSRGVVRLREEPVFCWVRLERDDIGNLHVKDIKLKNDVEDGLKIVLARAEVLNCQLDKDLSIAERRSARPPKQPYIACGTTDLTDSKVERHDSQSLVLSLEAKISTAGSGFLTAPYYSARVDGERIMTVSFDGGKVTLFLIEMINIQAPHPGDFTVQGLVVLIPLATSRLSTGGGPTPSFATRPGAFGMVMAAETSAPDALFAQAEKLIKSTWKLVWMGVEG